MINNLSILFSLAMVVYVGVRASMLDARQPWFPKTAAGEAPPDARRPTQARR